MKKVTFVLPIIRIRRIVLSYLCRDFKIRQKDVLAAMGFEEFLKIGLSSPYTYTPRRASNVF